MSDDVASWTAPQDIGKGEYMNLAGGPKGLFLKTRTPANTLEVRRFDGTTFGPSVAIPEGTGELPQSHMFQDASGRLHAVWPRIAADGTRLYYATSDDGTAWKSDVVLTTPDAIGSMRVATAPDRIGITAWEGRGSEIRVMSIGAQAGK
jgi:hypothetical protein